MIISHKYKYVCIVSPQSSTDASRRWLVDHYEGQKMFGHGSWRIPDECKNYFIFTIVRNPYKRCIEWWAKQTQKQMPFNEFLQHLIGCRDHPSNYSYHVPEICMTQKSYYVNSKAEKFIRYENMVEDLKTLPFVSDPAPLLSHKDIVDAEIDALSDQDKQIVLTYCDEDFDFFGYQRLPTP